MKTPHANAALRRRALLVLGIDISLLAPLLRVSDIVRPAKGVGDPAHGGLLPISARTFHQWVKAGLLPQPVHFAGGVSAWSRDAIIQVALDGVRREPGHGRKLTPPKEERPSQ